MVQKLTYSVYGEVRCLCKVILQVEISLKLTLCLLS